MTIANAQRPRLGRRVLEAALVRVDLGGVLDPDVLAREVGTTPHAVSRVLGRLRELGLVDQAQPGDARWWRLTRAGLQVADALAGSSRCRQCGCTEHVACDEGCWWVQPDLCSRCGEAPA